MGFDIKVTADGDVKRYYETMLEKCKAQYGLARKAKAVGKDISTEVECSPATDLADRSEQIIGPKGLAARFRELSAKHRERSAVIFKIFEEIINQKLVEIPNEEKRLEQAIKTALMLETEGIVVAPIDGVPAVKIAQNFDGSRYVDIFFAGPIRAAGGSAAVLPLILGDYARKLTGLDRYKPTGDEVERYVEEVMIYNESQARQYKITSEEVRNIVRNCPVCINGEPTEEREVTAHKDLERIPTNRVRGGMCLVICEGVALKAAKTLALARKLGLDWNWLEKIIKVNKVSEQEKKIEQNPKYLSSTAAGRPIFAYPSRVGALRLRYGRARNTGIMAKAIHPATMYLLDEFAAVGTQLKVERPGKSTTVFPCDTIEGPIVRLTNGDVTQVRTVERAMRLKKRIEKILFLGDCLVSYGDFRHTGHLLVPAGYCEEWWVLDLGGDVARGATAQGINLQRLIEKPRDVDCFTAVEASMQLGIPLHPKYLHYYNALSHEELMALIRAVKSGRTEFTKDSISALYLKNTPELKKSLEKIGLPHKVAGDELRIGPTYAYSFLKTMGGFSQEEPGTKDSNLGILSKISKIEIRDKGGTFIGARMGRPEAAKPRKMVGNPHVLFPVGLYGGATRSINKAAASEDRKSGSMGETEVEAPIMICRNCNTREEFASCPRCGSRTEVMRRCGKCNAITQEKKCRRCNTETVSFEKRKINTARLLEKAASNLGVNVPEVVKGVRGVTNEDRVFEPLEKGVLRARHDLHIFKDGTVRFEMLNAPLTHFRPEEIGQSIERLTELGYEKDVNGRKLEHADQVLELFPQDLIINEAAGDFFVRASQFLDELLERYYGLGPYYKAKAKEDLIGELVISIAPHTSAAVLGRIIGYTKARVNFAHPFFHLCKRRNCDGEQDSFMLLIDALINFSKSYLSASRGGRMDAPLVFTTVLKPTEIDDEAYDMEIACSYPLEFYERSREIVPPEIESVKRVANMLGTKNEYSGIGFTHDTKQFDEGPKMSRYVQLGTMEEKMSAQASIQSKIAAVDEKDALERVLVSHFLPDITGNARAFSKQTFRCTKCNTIHRRIPLSGKCTKCGGDTLILTIAEGSVRKYLSIAKSLIQNYGLRDYLKQRVLLIEQEVDSVFRSEKPAQKDLLGYV